MGTNFYMQLHESTDASVHLGKYSAGWEFTFRGDKTNGVVDLRSWYARVEKLSQEGYVLWNDNGSTISTPVELLRLIKEKKGAKKSEPKSNNEWLDPSGNYFLDEEFS
jgi:hypothetical protein